MTSLSSPPSSVYHDSLMRSPFSSHNAGGGLNDNNNGDERQVAKQALEASEESLRSLCLEYSTTFVSVERRGVALQISLQRLVEELHEASCNTVAEVREELCLTPSAANDEKQQQQRSSKAKQLEEISQTHQQRRRTLLQHSTLLDLLEIPNLMDACIRSELYDEALSIASFANTLERRHDIANTNILVANTKGGATVVASVVEEIRAREVELRHYLIQQFTKDITMPQCLELVTALRRLNGIELERAKGGGGACDLEGAHSAMELRLQVDFLEARDKWLEKNEVPFSSTSFSSITAPSQNSNNNNNAAQQQNEQFLDWIERHRTKCFEIATQFLAIFCTLTPSSLDGSSSTNNSPNQTTTTSYSLLSIWCTRRIQIFLSLLQAQLDSPSTLPYTSLSALRDALDATSFFAASMGRIGCDFTPLLQSIFETRVVRIVTRIWNEATESLDHTLRICREAGIAAPLVNNNTTSSEGEESIQQQQQQHHEGGVTVNAPRSLLQYPPLARLVNTFMGGLNDLRRCLLPGSFFLLRMNLYQKVIPSLKIILEANERKLLTPGMLRGDSIQLRQLATKYKVELVEVVEPFLLEALDIALGIPSTKDENADDDDDDDNNNVGNDITCDTAIAENQEEIGATISLESIHEETNERGNDNEHNNLVVDDYSSEKMKVGSVDEFENDVE